MALVVVSAGVGLRMTWYLCTFKCQICLSTLCEAGSLHCYIAQAKWPQAAGDSPISTSYFLQPPWDCKHCAPESGFCMDSGSSNPGHQVYMTSTVVGGVLTAESS